MNFAIRFDHIGVFQEIKIVHYFWASNRSVMTMNIELWIVNIEGEPQNKEVFLQLYHYLKVNSILSKFQSVFRPLHSTVSALIQICDGWSDNMDKGKLTGVVFHDIRKAFDSVDHSIFIARNIGQDVGRACAYRS